MMREGGRERMREDEDEKERERERREEREGRGEGGREGSGKGVPNAYEYNTHARGKRIEGCGHQLVADESAVWGEWSSGQQKLSIATKSHSWQPCLVSE